MGDEKTGREEPAKETAKKGDDGKGGGSSPPWLQIILAVIALVGTLGAAYIATTRSGGSSSSGQPTSTAPTATGTAATAGYIDCTRATDIYPNWCVDAQKPETAICADAQLRRLENCYLSYCDDPKYAALCKAGLPDWLQVRKDALTGKCRVDAGAAGDLAVDDACMTRVYNDRIKEFTGLGAMH
jgi:hypothetical protein